MELSSLVKLFGAVGGWLVSVIAVVLVVVFWIQSQGVEKYYPKLAGDNLEQQFVRMEQRLASLESGNLEIIRLLGRLETLADERSRQPRR